MSIQFFCPNCEAPFTVRDGWAGRKATCKKCRRKLTIPSLEDTHPHEDILSHRQKGDNEKYCSHCGEIINVKAEICPQCGVRQEGVRAVSPVQQASIKVTWGNFSVRQGSKSGRSKVVAGVLALLLGGIGIHKFYLGKPFQGVLYLLFCWTYIPSIVAFIEGVMYLCRSQESFDGRYNIVQLSKTRPFFAAAGPPAAALDGNEIMVCRRCEHSVRPGAKFCATCGQPADGRSPVPKYKTKPSSRPKAGGFLRWRMFCFLASGWLVSVILLEQTGLERMEPRPLVAVSMAFFLMAIIWVIAKLKDFLL